MGLRDRPPGRHHGLSRLTICAALVLGTFLAGPTGAHAGMTRLRVDWTSTWPDPPYVQVYVGWEFSGECGGSRSREPIFCQPQSDLHWENTLDQNGYPHTFTVVDDRPELARKICFRMGITSYGQYDVTATTTDPDGTQNTKTYRFDGGLGTGSGSLDCTPVGLPPARTPPPTPAWWLEGRKVVLGYGGTCHQASEVSELLLDRNFHSHAYLESGMGCDYRRPGRAAAYCGLFWNTPAGGDTDDHYECLIWAPKAKPNGRCFRKTGNGFWFERTPRGKILGEPKRLSTCLKDLRSR